MERTAKEIYVDNSTKLKKWIIKNGDVELEKLEAAGINLKDPETFTDENIKQLTGE